jgi:hypothetical protein
MALRPLRAKRRTPGETTRAKVDELYNEICEKDAAKRARAADPDSTNEVCCRSRSLTCR